MYSELPTASAVTSFVTGQTFQSYQPPTSQPSYGAGPTVLPEPFGFHGNFHSNPTTPGPITNKNYWQSSGRTIHLSAPADEIESVRDQLSNFPDSTSPVDNRQYPVLYIDPNPEGDSAITTAKWTEILGHMSTNINDGINEIRSTGWCTHVHNVDFVTKVADQMRTAFRMSISLDSRGRYIDAICIIVLQLFNDLDPNGAHNFQRKQGRMKYINMTKLGFFGKTFKDRFEAKVIDCCYYLFLVLTQTALNIVSLT